MSSWNSSYNYYPSSLYADIPLACTPYYYSYPPRAYQSPSSFERSSVISREQKVNLHRHDRNQSKILDDIKQPSEQTSISFHVHKTTKGYRFNLHKRKSHSRGNKKRPMQTSAPAVSRADNATRNDDSIDNYSQILKNQSSNITEIELGGILNKITSVMKNFNSNNMEQQQHQLPILIDILNALLDVNSVMLSSVSQNSFFSICQKYLIDILQQWQQKGSLTDDQTSTFSSTVKLASILTLSTTLIPSWLSDSTLLDTIATSLTHIANTGKFLDDNNKQPFRHFTHLIHTYTLYQQHLNQHPHSNKDTFIQLLHPVQLCLTSTHFVHSFATLSNSLTTSHKFFLLKCPAFISSYHGSALEETMHTLLSTMLPHYVTMLDKAMPSCSHWSQSMIRCVDALLSMINHGTGEFDNNVKLVSEHLPLIDHVLRLVDEASLYENISETLSNGETLLLNSAMRFLVIMKNESNILAHMKESHKTESFLRLTSCRYEGIVLNAYTLLAHATHEDDIKTIPNLNEILGKILQSLKSTLKEKSDKKSQTKQLLSILKGLVQHDQVKDEINKRNVLPYLVNLTDELTGKSLVLLYEILWSLTFSDNIARALRNNSAFVEKIQNVSKGDSNEAMKKAVDGLVWKLLKESAFLQKVVDHEVEAQEAARSKGTIRDRESDGETATLNTKEDNISSGERSFQYDIMISYCHTDKELTYKIYKFLVDQGFKVWIDLDNMYGPAMNAMAYAVENSEFVIMCMSDSYKQSTYCQAEAEYAFNCKRRLLPLIMRPGYRPDGWLGFLIGSRIYVDFGRFDFETACGKLMMEISLQRREAASNVSVNLLDHMSPTAATALITNPLEKEKKPSLRKLSEQSTANKDILATILKSVQQNTNFLRKHIETWTPSDVLNCLLVHHLQKIIPLCNEINGRELVQLHKICTTHRLQAYSIIKDELKSEHKIQITINDYTRLLTVIEDAMKASESLPTTSTIPVITRITPPPRLPSPAPAKLLSFPMSDYPLVTPPMTFIPAPNRNSSYDFLVTSNASALETLKVVHRYGSQLNILDCLRRRLTNVF
ncbi:unnamed protein product [Adineta ricciae]|uniref:TIR domain-containing protein n=1 Tax=Adineta ricciae TaxID=249248 RepID=A0A813UPU5_ADIRI|nr:unnamed protein product [Adineta ricciae]